MRQLAYKVTIPDSEIALLGSGATPVVPGFTTTNGKLQNVLVSGKYAYVAAGGANSTGTIGLSLVIYDVSDVTNPTAVGYLTTGTVPWVSGASYLNGSYKMDINGKYLYVFSSGSSYMYIVDVSNPTTPTNISRLLISNSPGSLYNGVYSNGYCYISTQNKGLTIVDVSNPLSPTQVYQEGGTTNKSLGVAIYGTVCFTTNYQTTAPWTVRYLKAWNVATPTAPVLLSTYTLPAGTKPGTVAVDSHYAYVADYNTNRIQIVDISNLLSMNYISYMQASATFSVESNALFDVKVTDKYAYICSGGNATYGGAIDFYDITTPASPVLVKTYKQNVANSAFGTGVIVNNVLYVANYGISPGNAGSLNTYSVQSYASNPIKVVNMVNSSVQLIVSNSSAAGVFSIQGSDDITGVGMYTTLPNGAITVSGAGTYLTPSLDTCYQYIRVTYTNTGTGGLVSQLKFLNS